MKKMLLATALALLVVCQMLLSGNKPAAVVQRETITHHFFVSGIGQKKTVDAAKICGGENVVKTETQQTFVNGCRFYYFRYFIPLEARVLLANNW